MDTLPFKLSNVFGGFADGDGLIHNDGAHLTLEYQVKDGLVGVIKSEIKQFSIPFDELVSVTLTKGWFGTNWGAKLVVQSNRLDAFQDIPGASQGRVELGIAAKDHDAAEDFVYRLYQTADAPMTSKS